MSTSLPEYVKLEIEASNETPELGFDLNGYKFTVPPLGPQTVPAGLFAVAARSMSGGYDDRPYEIIAAFLDELYAWKPEMGKRLKRLPMAWTDGFIKQWTERSKEFGVDPKASSSSR